MASIEIKEEEQTSSEDHERLLCRTCLCSDKYRRLYVLTDYRRIYIEICGIQDVDHSTEIHLCWECITLLRKFISFKEKTQKLQEMFNLDYKKNPPTCLSTLTFTRTHKTEYLGDNINKEFELTLKEEPDSESDLFDNSHEDDINESNSIDMAYKIDTGHIDDEIETDSIEDSKIWIGEGPSILKEESNNKSKKRKKNKARKKAGHIDEKIIDTHHIDEETDIDQKDDEKPYNAVSSAILKAETKNKSNKRKKNYTASIARKTRQNPGHVDNEIDTCQKDDDKDCTVEASAISKEESKHKSNKRKKNYTASVARKTRQNPGYKDDEIDTSQIDDDKDWMAEASPKIKEESKNKRNKRKKDDKVVSTDSKTRQNTGHVDDETVADLIDDEIDTVHKYDDNDSDYKDDETDSDQKNDDKDWIPEFSDSKEETTFKRNFIVVSSASVKDIIIRVAIPFNEIKSWREKERNSEYFVNLVNKCEICFHRLKIDETLEKHNQRFHTVTRKRPYQCDICKVVLMEKFRNSHMMTHQYFYQCVTCGYQCYGYTHMTVHVRSHNVIKCPKCDAVFSDIRVCQYHFRSLHTRAVCDYCKKGYPNKAKLETHIKSYHTIIRCEVCNKACKTLTKYNEHYKLRHTIERIEESFCVQCNVQFNNPALYRNHLRVSVAHMSERGVENSFKCLECPKTYKKKSTMMDHYQFVHCNSREHYCAICNKTYISASKLKAHRRRCHEGIPVVKNKFCNICGRGFSTKRILEHHIRTHTGERPFQCHLCNAAFAQKTARQTHIKAIHYKNKSLPSSDLK